MSYIQIALYFISNKKYLFKGKIGGSCERAVGLDAVRPDALFPDGRENGLLFPFGYEFLQ